MVAGRVFDHRLRQYFCGHKDVSHSFTTLAFVLVSEAPTPLDGNCYQTGYEHEIYGVYSFLTNIIKK